jgi:hypothetical protein
MGGHNERNKGKRNASSPLKKISKKQKDKPLCTQCNEPIKNINDSILCDDCENLTHLKCANISKKNVPNTLTYHCPPCQDRIKNLNVQEQEETESSDNDDPIQSVQHQAQAKLPPPRARRTTNNQILELLINNKRESEDRHNDLISHLNRLDASNDANTAHATKNSDELASTNEEVAILRSQVTKLTASFSRSITQMSDLSTANTRTNETLAAIQADIKNLASRPPQATTPVSQSAPPIASTTKDSTTRLTAPLNLSSAHAINPQLRPTCAPMSTQHRPPIITHQLRPPSTSHYVSYQLPSSSNQAPNQSHPSHQRTWNLPLRPRLSTSGPSHRNQRPTSSETSRMLFALHVPITQGEDLRNTVIQIAETLGLSINPTVIESAYRIRSRTDTIHTTPPHICVIFADTYTKNLFHRAAKLQRPSLRSLNLTTNILTNPPSIPVPLTFTEAQLDKPIFINEHLSPIIRNLQAQARNLRAAVPPAIHAHYTNDGALWIVRAPNTAAIPIQSQEDLDDLLALPPPNND